MWVLLVDDDLATVTTIHDAIDWEKFGFERAVSAYNVAGAIREIETRSAPPELIVCDIEMPMGSGLDLLKWVRGKGYECEFIFLTCHESFRYASEALEYRAGSYIVKPFNLEKMTIAIKKSLLEIHRREYLTEYSAYGEYWMRSKDDLLSTFWRSLLFFRLADEEIEPQIVKRNLQLRLDREYTLVLIRIPSCSDEDLQGKLSEWDLPSYQFTIKRLACEAVLDEFILGNAVDYTDSGFDYIALLSSGKIEDLEKGCRVFVQSYQEHLPTSHGKPVICIGKPVLLPLLGEKRLELEKLMQNHLDSGEILIEGIAISRQNARYQPLDADLLTQYLEQGNRIEILNYMRSYLTRLSAENGIDRLVLRLLHQDFLQLLYSYLQKHEIQAHRLYMDSVSKQLQETAEHSAFDMVKWVSFVTGKALACVEETKQTGTVVFNAMSYIREHFRENISRDEVAAAVFVTSSYLSRIFHQETGFKITDFLTRCRIEEAKALLRNTDHSISDIAVESGFDSFSYFSTVFKKVTGITPVQYRKEGL